MAIEKKNIRNVLKTIVELKNKPSVNIVEYWRAIGYLEATLQSFDVISANKEDDNYVFNYTKEIIIKQKLIIFNIKLKDIVRDEKLDETLIRLAINFLNDKK